MKKLERYTGKAASFAAFLLFCVVCPTALMASVDISPVVVELSEAHDKEVVRIGNGTESAKSFQVDVVAWSQSDPEREIYTPTDDLLAVPPLFTLEAGKEQVVGRRVDLTLCVRLRPGDHVDLERLHRQYVRHDLG